eukprot:TRINITY_DN94394_c0_g1_i1.p1 TRINITY_DN94394_c0_g1~~TRINITY_DN94394_c0_g1_i1.p1  ORF type:complete len:637 (+),score=39.97 TRINITY_DN94394_c0_g1_i1:41-1951(+)
MPTSSFGCTEFVFAISFSLCALLYTALFTGWAQLQLMLLGEGQFHELCGDGKQIGIKPCPSQLERFSLFYTVAVATFCACMLPAGLAIDRGKVTALWLVSILLQVPSLALLGYADSVKLNVFMPCLIAQAAGGAIVFISLIPMTQVFTVFKVQYRVLCVAVILYHTASATFTAFYELNKIAALSRRNFFIGLSVGAFVLQSTTLLLYRHLKSKVEIFEYEMEVIIPTYTPQHDITSTALPYPSTPHREGTHGDVISDTADPYSLNTQLNTLMDVQENSRIVDGDSYFMETPTQHWRTGANDEPLSTPQRNAPDGSFTRQKSPRSLPFEISDDDTSLSDVSGCGLLDKEGDKKKKRKSRKRKPKRVAATNLQELRHHSLADQIHTPIFCFLAFFVPVLISRNFCYIGFSRDMLDQMGASHHNYIHLRVFSYLLCGASLIGPLVGWVLRVLGLGWSMHLINALTLISTLITLVQNLHVQFLAFVIFTISRPLTFSVLGALVSHIFGTGTSGSIQGILFLVTSLLLMGMYLALRFIFEHKGGDFLWLNAPYGVMEILLIVLIEWARKWLRRMDPASYAEKKPRTKEKRAMEDSNKVNPDERKEEGSEDDDNLSFQLEDDHLEINPTFGAVARVLGDDAL